MALKQLYINSVGTGTYGIYITSDTYLNAPAPDYTAHKVPGRSGALVQWNNRLQNVIRKFECYIPDSVQANFDAFKKMLYSNIGYMKLTSDYETDTYQMGYLAEDIEATPFQSDGKLTTTFELYFSCEPQKYFNTNTAKTVIPNTPFAVQRVFARTHPLIQQLFQQLPADAVPDGEGFLVIGTNGISSLTLSDVSFSMSGYGGFVALILADYVWSSNASFKELIGYSNFGSVSVPGYSQTIPAGGYRAWAAVLPVDAVGTMSLGYQINGTSFTDSWILKSQAQLTNVNAIGVSYNLEISGEYGRASSDEYDDYGFYVTGQIGGKTSFAALIELDTTVFRAMSVAGNTYTVKITIDSRDMSISALFDGDPVNIYNYVSVHGDLEGMADQMDVFWYHFKQTPGQHTQDPLIVSNIKVTPVWWKV